MTSSERDAAAQRSQRRAGAITTARHRIETMPATRREVLSRQFENIDEQGRAAARRSTPGPS